jgi:hypothetical protein
MTKFKDFGSGALEEKEPISFKIYEEEFHCVTSIQGKTLLNFVKRSQSEDPLESAAVMEEFFEKVLLDESLERFNALTVDKERVVSVTTLAEIVSWLISEYTDRPNQQPEA